MTVKIVTIIGARPQFVKAAIVSHAIHCNPAINEILVHTGQHYDANMSDIFFDELEIPKPDYHLGVGSGTHGQQTAEILIGIENILLREKPDWLLIYGDTNSTLAGALAAAKLHIPVAHVEAGLRSFNQRMPEEINRIVSDQLSSLLFAPTEQAMINLSNEGISKSRTHYVGDVMYDAALYYGQKANNKSIILDRLSISPKEYVLLTIHRAENTDDEARLSAIFTGLSMLANEVPVILPLHPRTRKMLNQFGLLDNCSKQLHLVEPVGFIDMMMLEQHALVIATDSGGVQKEAFFYQVPCVTLRNETEWVELVEAGWNTVLPPTNAINIYSQIKRSINLKGSITTKPYGNGDASRLIVNLLS